MKRVSIPIEDNPNSDTYLWWGRVNTAERLNTPAAKTVHLRQRKKRACNAYPDDL